VEINLKQNLSHTIMTPEGEKELTLDLNQNRMEQDFVPDDHYIPHKGKVLSMPRSLSKKAIRWGINLDEMCEGDTVYTSHLAVNENNKLGEDQYFVSIPRDMVGTISSFFIAKEVKGEIIPLYDWNMFEPVEEVKESTIIIPEYLKKKKREDLMILKKPSKSLKEEGYKPGDRFIVHKDKVYPIKINNEVMVFVRNENLLLKVINS